MKLPRSFVRLCLPVLLGSALMGTTALPQTAVAQTATTQESATALLADQISFDGQLLIASGSVEVFREGATLSAARILYDNANGTLTIEGPIRLTQPGGDTMILASQAALDDDLRNGILSSARLMVDQQFQAAAAQMDLIDGRYIRLQHAVASTCEVCANNPTPFWEIRAKEIIHDQLERQLFFDSATLRIAGTPVLWLPHLRVPDPTLERATGFLLPKLKNDTLLGTGLEIPYFIKLGDHKDLTLTPLLATKSRALDLRYRQAFARGDLEFNSAIAWDDTADDPRGYGFLAGEWRLDNGVTLGFDARATSDIAYLRDYDVFGGDRLPSKAYLERFRENDALEAQFLYLRTLRESEVAIEDSLPFILGDFSYETGLESRAIPGQIHLGFTATGAYRKSSQDIDGYDVLRLGAFADWHHSAILASGLRIDGAAQINLDGYLTTQNSSVDAQVLRATPNASVKLSYPMQRRFASGTAQILDPFVQLSWSDTLGGDIPNSDSSLVEFDEGNLLDFSRYPGADLRDSGSNIIAGLSFSHIGARAKLQTTAGRIFNIADPAQYSTASGLSDGDSDWLISASSDWRNGLNLTSRALFADDLSLTKWDTRIGFNRAQYDLGATYSYVIADLDENRDTDLSELYLDSQFKLGPFWSASADLRYDFAADEATEAGLKLIYETECARVELGAVRDYADTNALDPRTSYSFAIGLGAFGKKAPSRNCAL